MESDDKRYGADRWGDDGSYLRDDEEDICIGNNMSDSSYRRATNLEEERTGRREASPDCGGIGFAGAAGIITAGYLLYELIF